VNRKGNYELSESEIPFRELTRLVLPKASLFEQKEDLNKTDFRGRFAINKLKGKVISLDYNIN